MKTSKENNFVQTSLDSYLSAIANAPKLTESEEQELARRIHKGDEKALNILVTANLLFVVKEAKLYQNRGLALEDLIEEGNIGLIKAAHKYDESRGTRFVTVAKWWIKDAIINALEEKGRMIRLPHGQEQLCNEIRSIRQRYEADEEREATIYEVADELGMEVGKLQDVYTASQNVMSLEVPMGDADDDDYTLLSKLGYADEAMTDFALLHEELEYAFSSVLSERETTIVRQSFGLGTEEKTLVEIAQSLGLSRERVRQIRELAVGKLKSLMSDCQLRPCC